MAVLLYPVYIVVFYFYDLPRLLLHKFGQINEHLYNLFSIKLLLTSFFQPLKNEYHEGLVLFSRVAGVVVKTFCLGIGFSVLLSAIILELTTAIIVITFPFWFFYLLFLT